MKGNCVLSSAKVTLIFPNDEVAVTSVLAAIQN